MNHWEANLANHPSACTCKGCNDRRLQRLFPTAVADPAPPPATHPFELVWTHYPSYSALDVNGRRYAEGYAAGLGCHRQYRMETPQGSILVATTLDALQDKVDRHLALYQKAVWGWLSRSTAT